jgi:protein phosphatase
MNTLAICGKSDIGKKREHNEDAFLIGNIVENREKVYLEIPLESSFIKNYGLLVAVADGMGGHQAGEIASDAALNLLSRQLMSTSKDRVQNDEIMNILRKSIVSAHNALYDMSMNNPNYSGMGTTIAGLFFCKDALYTLHAGDSRVYRLRNGGLFQMTKDHSLVQAMVNAGQITMEESYKHPQKNVITNSLGGGDSKCEPEITDKYGYFEDDLFLICSDGLTDMVNEEEIVRILDEQIPIKKKVDNLITKANENGGEDNITITLIEMQNNR